MILGLEAWVFWLILMALFVIIEVSTQNLVTIWFAAGCLVAIVAAILGADIVLQTVIACGISAVTVAIILIFKPFKVGKDAEQIPTNFDRVIGMCGIVDEEIDCVEGSGLVHVMGQQWSATAPDECKIEKGSRVRIESVSGVKLVVSKIKEGE